ncbi:MAG: phage tail tip lysozyme [Lachnospiraceae bacterium]|nr:phage tail tip lysozyme [Lachnospiraceae bacterium]
MLKGNDTAKKIWNYLIGNGLTPYGAAGLMGNLQAESGLVPNRVEILCLKRLKENGKTYTDAVYTAAVDCGTITRKQFLNPLPNRQYGYGLAQWTSPSRKGGLYDLCRKRGVSIADLETQLVWLMTELTVSYRKVLDVLKSAGTVKEASDCVLCNFEQPDDCGPSVRAYRAGLGQKYYDAYSRDEQNTQIEM